MIVILVDVCGMLIGLSPVVSEKEVVNKICLSIVIQVTQENRENEFVGTFFLRSSIQLLVFK